MSASRLERLPAIALPGGVRVAVASTARARLLGLAGLPGLPPGWALLLPRCRSVHTFGMRFALDVVFVDEAGRPVRVERAVRPGRVLAARTARAVLEAPAPAPPALLRGLPTSVSLPGPAAPGARAGPARTSRGRTPARRSSR